MTAKKTAHWSKRLQHLAGALALLGGALASAATGSLQKPNLLLVLADNWAWPHASVLGDRTVSTPAFDRLVKEGALFTHAFCPVPSCTPTRSSLLTGRAAHQLEEGANLHGGFSTQFRVFPQILRENGYAIGYGAKGWGPGRADLSGWKENPAGPRFGPATYGLGQSGDRAAQQDRAQFKGFEEFMQQRPKNQPFFFWLGFTHPGRPTWIEGDGQARGLKLESVKVPAYLPDVPEGRRAILDYYASVVRLDALIGRVLSLLQTEGALDNTVVVCCSDNGWQMPRGLANVYDAGCRVPLVVRWPGRVKAGRRIDDFVSLTDLAPTFLELAGLRPLPEMTGRSFVDLLIGKPKGPPRDAVFLERERHANVRQGNLSYPMRAIRTRDFLYIRNLRPDRWPAGDPKLWFAVGEYGDVDDSPAKQFVLAHANDPNYRRFYEWAFAKRPSEELYDLRADPDQLVNVAGQARYAGAQRKLRKRLDDWMRETADPRVDPAYDGFDTYPYYGNPVPGAPGSITRSSP